MFFNSKWKLKALLSGTLLKNPMFLFVYGILSKFYIIIIFSSVVVTYWVFKGLHDIGLIDKAQEVLVTTLKESKAIAKYCTPKIVKPKQFWDCLSNVPNYIQTEEEDELYRNLETMMQNITKDNDEQKRRENKGYNTYQDPYSKK